MPSGQTFLDALRTNAEGASIPRPDLGAARLHLAVRSPPVSSVQLSLSSGVGLQVSIRQTPPVHQEDHPMKINLRGRRAYLYRRRWVPVGPGVPHAHPAEHYIGAIDADAESIPPELLTVLTEAEQAQIQEKVFCPAAQARAAAAKRQQDPMWRIAEASRLLSEAAQCSQSALVPGSSLTSVRMAMDNIRLLDPTPVRTPTPEPRPSADKLADALVAVKAAAEAVRMGTYGLAPVEGARSTRPYRLWSDIFQAVEGGERSLLRALQDKGFVKTRKGS